MIVRIAHSSLSVVVILILLSVVVVVDGFSVVLEQQKQRYKKRIEETAPMKALKDVRDTLSTRSSSVNGKTPPSNHSTAPPIPFLIERLTGQPNPAIFTEIANMCITAFFDDSTEYFQSSAKKSLGGSSTTTTPFWKEWQLRYLRKLQSSDLDRRRRRDPGTNAMFVARRVIPATSAAVRKTPLIMDVSRIQNLSPTAAIASDNNDYVRGEIVGFAEVTMRPYGLGGSGGDYDDDDMYEKRPILTNLSVRSEARKSGVGSSLVRACERAVRRDWKANEIILEVEEDNTRAQTFYQNRGYEILFEDPASRRYDTTGLWLQQVRCKRLVMRKQLGPSSSSVVDSHAVQSTLNFGIQALQRFRDNMLASFSSSSSSS